MEPNTNLAPTPDTPVQRPVTKQELWERKLLDLSLRNPLLNYRPGSASLQCLADDLRVLEDELAKGVDLRLCAMPEETVLTIDDEKFYHAEDAETAKLSAAEALKSHKLLGCAHETDLSQTLKKLHRAAKVSLEENGANTLYLAVGFLKWFESDRAAKPRYAPLVLLPVDLVRRITGQTYSLRIRDEDTQINITLLELLRQDYGIRIDGLDPVPEDENGADLAKIYDTIREAVALHPDWSIEPLCVLGQFSFSQFIMWNDIRTRSEELRQNKVVASLLSGALEWEPHTEDLSPAQLDAKVKPSDMAVPTSADSSQLAAIYAASRGESFVLHGPPGTGKSQTITNMIANALYHGKSVLFVAEKMAALSVVQNRLAKLGLDPFCLELHSNKAQKRAVLSQLDATLQVGRVKSPTAYLSAAEDLSRRRMELDSIMQSLHAVQPIGMSLYDAVTEYDALKPYLGRVRLPQDFARNISSADHAAAIETIGRIVAADAELGGLADSPLRDYRRTDYAPGVREGFVQAVQAFRDACGSAAQSFDALQIGEPGTYDAYTGSLEVLKTARNGDYLPAALTGEDVLSSRSAELSALFEKGTQCQKLTDELLAAFDPTLLALNGEQQKLAWKENELKWALAKTLGRSKLVKALQVHAKNPGAVTAENYLAVCDKLIAMQSLRSELAGVDQTLVQPFGTLWQGEKTDFGNLRTLMQNTIALRKHLQPFQNPQLTSALQQPTSPALAGALAARDALDKALHALTDEYKLDQKALQADGDFFPAAVTAAEGWMQGSPLLRERSALEVLLADLDGKGLGALTAAYRRGDIPAGELEDCYRCEAARCTIEAALTPELGGLTGTQLDVRIEEYRKAADQFAALTVQELAARLSAKVPAPGEALKGNSEISVLQRAIKSGGRMLSIRKLFESIPQLLRRICPCMLMSPISVAQYIDPSFPKFDLVIFDEASQLPTSEAVGAIARGENAVIVGDPKQLPPTAFFTSQHFDEENADKEDLESVLDDCLALSMPSRHLLWHYRSRHESLIAFSNHNFYDSKLLTFPSPDDLVPRVTRVPVEGFYDKSKTRQNRAEAEAVVAEIVRRLRDEALRQESIGVVTFSVVQQNLIDDLLTEAYVQEPKLEEWANAMYEPIFIKNLENVQGDERDVILFSIGYGPDENGDISMNFGPINQDGGWRRLNVAVSRARREMKVFSVIRPDQIDLSRTSAVGVEKLKAFLAFADHGAAPQEMQETARQDAFAKRLAQGLEERGYTVKCGVGSSGYRVDAAVVHPEDPNRFLLAILCGSKQNAESSSARDRCISQPSVLRGLGWHVCNVHILDWLDAPERTLDRVEAAIREALADEQKPPEPEPAVTFAAEDFERVEQSTVQSEPYEPCELGTLGSPESFLLPMAQPKICDAIRQVIAQEAPVSRKVVQKRILAAWGMSRMSQKAEAVFQKAFQTVMPSSTGEGEQEFFWRDDQIPSAYTAFRCGTGTGKRSIEEICPEELCSAVMAVLRTCVSAPLPELNRAAAKSLGFVRMTPALDAALSQAVTLAVSRGVAKIDGEQVVLV